jgi:hypothetical protein
LTGGQGVAGSSPAVPTGRRPAEPSGWLEGSQTGSQTSNDAVIAETAQRRGHHEDSIYFDASKNRWIGAISLGFSPDGERRIRQKVRGRTKTEVRDKLQALHRELDLGVHTSATYTVAACIQDWLAHGLTSSQPSTVDNYTHLASHLNWQARRSEA